eukprot:CAMPEP_0177607358 /NCGR_PEP_ID=MMETSP0419_2-20121207/17874_1 /TAXON_ID=582737 /ORGANISM="Tetraselmis sp., Strain GSL018" /LENGTH=349 /DNA_ID=CAMNT_0019101933 /DNA_START=322 /DNA_END=1371 /DNA_ORIENTATION=+
MPNSLKGQAESFSEETSLLVFNSAGQLRRTSSEQDLDCDGLEGARGKHRGKRNREDSEKTGRNSRPLETIRDEVRQKLSEIRFVNQYNRLITHRRQFIIWNATLKSIIQRHFLEYFDDQTGSTLVYAFPSKLMALLPMDEPLLDYETCAVVGNSGVTLLRLDGKDIDGHDAVFRINLAPVRGFEDHVGSKTTFQVINSPNIREMLTGTLRWRASDNETRLVMFETAARFARHHLAAPLLEEHGSRALLLSPSFSNHCEQLWRTLKESLEAETGVAFHRKPMSGFFAVLMALQVCDRVDLYGFDAYTSSRTKNLYHYFDHVEGFTGVHSFDLAMHIFRKIQEIGLLTIKS